MKSGGAIERFPWILAFGVIPFLIFIIGLDVWGHFQLAHNGVRTPGIVSALHPQDHNTVDYHFAYQGMTFLGTDNRLDGLHIGSAVTVTLDPRHPQHSTIHNPMMDVKAGLGAMLLVIVVPIIAYFVLRLIGKRRGVKPQVVR